jgi:hypothetical protein
MEAKVGTFCEGIAEETVADECGHCKGMFG